MLVCKLKYYEIVSVGQANKKADHEMSANFALVASNRGPACTTLAEAASPHSRLTGRLTVGATSLHANNLITLPPLQCTTHTGSA